MQRDWAKQVDWGRSVGEEEKQQLFQLVQVKEKLHPLLLSLAQRGLLPSFLFVCVYQEEKSQIRATKGDCKVMEILSSLDICQWMKKQNMKDDNLGGSSLAAPSLPKKDLPSQIPSFLVEVQRSIGRLTASSFLLVETGTNHCFWKCVNFLNNNNCFSYFLVSDWIEMGLCYPNQAGNNVRVAYPYITIHAVTYSWRLSGL